MWVRTLWYTWWSGDNSGCPAVTLHLIALRSVSYCSAPQHWGSHTATSSFLYGAWGLELMSSCLHSKHSEVKAHGTAPVWLFLNMDPRDYTRLFILAWEALHQMSQFPSPLNSFGFLFCFWDRDSVHIHSPGCPVAHYVDQVASASQVLVFKGVCHQTWRILFNLGFSLSV